MAYKVHYGREISKSEFGGGMETVRFFNRLGFEIEYHGETEARKQTVPSDIKKVILAKETKKEQQKAETVSAKKEKSEKESASSEKIVIPSKEVIEQKNALQLILNRLFDGDIVCEKTFDWLKTPEIITGDYEQVYKALHEYRGDTAFAKKNVTLRCDFVCESRKLIIEYDERQHFSQARKISLEAYRNIPVLFDRELWIKACNDISAKDNSPVNRDEIRAFYDSTRDIACYQNGYRLIRIMHGQMDFNKPDTEQYLKIMLGMESDQKESSGENENRLKVAMFLQTDELKNLKSFREVLPLLKSCDADIVVFPECCYVPFVQDMVNRDIFEDKDQKHILDLCLEFSREIKKAVVISSEDRFNTIFSVFANAYATGDETKTTLYVKHTMAGSSCLDIPNYYDIAPGIFDPAVIKNFLVGMTICYDCNHALFSRMYGYYGIDLIVNSTGGDVIYDKWFKYNKARAIENNCYTLVTMGHDGTAENNHNFVFGFNKNGGRIEPVNLNGKSDRNNYPGGLYLYEITKDDGEGEADTSNQLETENKNWQLEFPAGKSGDVISRSEKVAVSIYREKNGDANVFYLLVDGMDIMLPEIVQPLLYSEKIRRYPNRRYVIVNRHKSVDRKFFEEKLSIILKVRAMENFCAVVFESEDGSKCYQCGKNRTAQVVKATDGIFGIDLDRTSGPEAIWKDKPGMRKSWRKNYEWLVQNATTLYSE
ncbi:MAG: hypothetical protein MJ059_02570 [Lachnospiraceae bacterium]|nr:hypothetical protein [Lachnospiraceae bacterium]